MRPAVVGLNEVVEFLHEEGHDVVAKEFLTRFGGNGILGTAMAVDNTKAGVVSGQEVVVKLLDGSSSSMTHVSSLTDHNHHVGADGGGPDSSTTRARLSGNSNDVLRATSAITYSTGGGSNGGGTSHTDGASHPAFDPTDPSSPTTIARLQQLDGLSSNEAPPITCAAGQLCGMKGKKCHATRHVCPQCKKPVHGVCCGVEDPKTDCSLTENVICFVCCDDNKGKQGKARVKMQQMYKHQLTQCRIRISILLYINSHHSCSPPTNQQQSCCISRHY